MSYTVAPLRDFASSCIFFLPTLMHDFPLINKIFAENEGQGLQAWSDESFKLWVWATVCNYDSLNI